MEINRVRLGGPIFAGLHRVCVSEASAKPCGGLLFGRYATMTTKVVGDHHHAENEAVKQLRDAVITACVSYPETADLSLASDANSDDLFNRERLAKFVRERKDTLLGWYRFRRASSLQASLREKIFHLQLGDFMSNHCQVVSAPPVFICMTSLRKSNTKDCDDKSTLGFLYRVFSCANPGPDLPPVSEDVPCSLPFQAIPVEVSSITELSQTSYQKDEESGVVESQALNSAIEQNIGRLLAAEGNMAQVAPINTVCDAVIGRIRDLSEEDVSLQSAIQERLRELNALTREIDIFEEEREERRKSEREPIELVDVIESSEGDEEETYAPSPTV